MAKKPALKGKDKWQICAMIGCLLDGAFSLKEIHDNFWPVIKVHYEAMLLSRDASVLITSTEYQNALALKSNAIKANEDDKPETALTPRNKMSIAMWLLDKFDDKDEAVLFVKKARSLYV